MGTPRIRRRRIGRREADQLLAGASADRPELAGMLRAAAEPGYPDELDGETAAVALFARQYELGRTGAAGPAYRLMRARPARTRPLTLRLAAAAGALLCAGLVAGAEAGMLPTALQAPAHRLFGAPTGAGPSGGSARPSTNPLPSPQAIASPGGTLPTWSGTGTPAAALVSLCVTYQDDPTALAARQLAELRAAAGGTPRVAAYCAAVLGAAASPGSQATAQATAHPSHPAKPTKTHSPKPAKK